MVARKKLAGATADSGPEIDLDAAAKFLRWLDHDAEEFTFQTWDDDRKRGDGRLVRLLHGRFEEHAEDLAELNRRGAAVAVTMNETDLKGTKRENIVRARALVTDLDNPDDERALDRVRACALRPHRIVETSPGRYHVYWLIEDGDGVVLHEFEGIQRAIAMRFGGDPAVAMLTHRARLPGFLHNKGVPFLVHTLSWQPHAPHDWDAICAEFPPPKKPHKPAGSHVVLVDGAPVKNGETFVEQRYQRDGRPLLRCYQNVFYSWTGSHWREMRDDMLEHELYGFLANALVTKKGALVPFNPTKNKVAEIVHALRRALIIDHRLRPPAWLEPAERTAENQVACRNGILNLRTRELLPHDPDFFTTICLPLDYDPSAPEPKRWLQFLVELWPDDEEAEETLQEICGYLLTPDTSQQKAFLIVGPKRAGKGTIIHVVTTLLGEDNVVSVTLNSMAGEFGRWPLIDKLLAVIADARLGARANSHTIAEHLLSISGGDQQTINRKLQSFWTGYLSVRFLITTNELPEIADASGTLPSRFIVLQLKESFYGKEDTKLRAKLTPELPGILNWALAGLDRLTQRGYFVMPKSSGAAVREMEDLSSPIKAFLREWGEVDKDAEVLVKEFYAAYRAWATDAGHKISPKNVFGKTLRSLVPKMRVSSSGDRRRYLGIGLSEGGRDLWDECRHERGR
jgi:putative DNA primase/helicase